MLDLNKVQELLVGNALVRKTKLLPTGHLRVGTWFLLPDNDYIDVFVPNIEKQVVTDFAEIIMWFMIQGIDIRKFKKLSRRIEETQATFGCYREGGAIQYEVLNEHGVALALLQLTQCLLRVSNFIYTVRSQY